MRDDTTSFPARRHAREPGPLSAPGRTRRVRAFDSLQVDPSDLAHPAQVVAGRPNVSGVQSQDRAHGVGRVTQTKQSPGDRCGREDSRHDAT